MPGYRGSAPLKENVPLAPYTTMGVGGPARFMIEAREESHAAEALEFARAGGWPVFVLGGGSNIVVSDAGFPGLVLRIALRGVTAKTVGNRVDVAAAAGEEWDPFVAWCVARNLAGLECLSGIPGTVGGTPVQNVGAYGQEVSDVIERVRLLDRENLSLVELDRAGCGFSYRASIFNGSLRERYIVTSVVYNLLSGGRAQIRYADLQRHFVGAGECPPLAEVRAAVLKIRTAKAMVLAPGDPDSRSAGSFFKNPVVTQETAKHAESAARDRGNLAPDENLPRFPAFDGMVKIPAARLIERAGFRKGYSRGRAGLSSRHALAIVNRGDARAGDIIGLAQDIQAAVRAVFGIDLIPEPVFVGFDHGPLRGSVFVPFSAK